MSIPFTPPFRLVYATQRFQYILQIDWETTVSQKGRVCVRQGIDTDLDELRRQLNGLPSLLVSALISFAGYCTE